MIQKMSYTLNYLILRIDRGSRLYTYKVQDIMHRFKYISYLFYQFHFQNIYFLQADPIDFSLAKRSGARKVTPAIDISM